MASFQLVDDKFYEMDVINPANSINILRSVYNRSILTLLKRENIQKDVAIV